MNEDARIALLQEILAGLIDRGQLAPLPEAADDDAPVRLAVLPARRTAARSKLAASTMIKPR
jgi:hypothetical protein